VWIFDEAMRRVDISGDFCYNSRGKCGFKKRERGGQAMLKKDGFTLLELLVVIGIMSVLAGLLLPALGKARSRARAASAQSMISSLQTALSMYNLDWGVFPASATGTGVGDQNNMNSYGTGTNYNLVYALTQTARGGPYMEFKGGDLLDSGGSAVKRYVARDPWGRAYVYMSRRLYDGSPVDTGVGPFHPYDDPAADRVHNTYNIYSLGPDGLTDGVTDPGSDWNDGTLVNSATRGDWRTASSSSDPRYDDINSWDGARR